MSNINALSVRLCTGCSACASICPHNCIAMTPSSDGFSCPEITAPEACVQCGLCEKACPVLAESEKTETLPTAYAAYSKDCALRMDSSSGGIFSEVAKVVLDQGGVVYGAAYDEAFEVVHSCVESVSELEKLRGAKYAQSRLDGTFREVLSRLKCGQMVLFSGTPCQVAGLKAFLRKDYENLICIDFVCHGVPSPMAWREYVKYRAAQDNEGKLPEAINLRSKKTGWSRYRYSNRFQYGNGKIHSTSTSESLFMKLFVGDYINRSSCENCRFKGYSRVSDLTIGDFWGIWDIAPEMDDDRGTSLVLIQSEKGRQIIEHIRDRLEMKLVTLEEAVRQNPSLLESSKAKLERAQVLEEIRNGKIAECERQFVVKKLSVVRRIKRKLRNLMRK